MILKKMKSRKAAGLHKIPPEMQKTIKFDDILLPMCSTVYKQNRVEK